MAGDMLDAWDRLGQLNVILACVKVRWRARMLAFRI